MKKNRLKGFKNIFIKIVFIILGLSSAFIIFISLVSIRIGIKNINQDGFWVPIVSGLLLITLVLSFLFYVSRKLLDKIKVKDTITDI